MKLSTITKAQFNTRAKRLGNFNQDVQDMLGYAIDQAMNANFNPFNQLLAAMPTNSRAPKRVAKYVRAIVKGVSFDFDNNKVVKKGAIKLLNPEVFTKTTWFEYTAPKKSTEPKLKTASDVAKYITSQLSTQKYDESGRLALQHALDAIEVIAAEKPAAGKSSAKVPANVH